MWKLRSRCCTSSLIYVYIFVFYYTKDSLVVIMASRAWTAETVHAADRVWTVDTRFVIHSYASMFISSPATWISGSGTTSSCRYLLVWLYLPRHLTVAIIYLAVVPIFFSPMAHKITSIQCQYNSQTISTETDFIDANHFFTDPSYMEQTTIEIN